jgi:hypothetical protein
MTKSNDGYLELRGLSAPLTGFEDHFERPQLIEMADDYLVHSFVKVFFSDLVYLQSRMFHPMS